MAGGRGEGEGGGGGEGGQSIAAMMKSALDITLTKELEYLTTEGEEGKGGGEGGGKGGMRSFAKRRQSLGATGGITPRGGGERYVSKTPRGRSEGEKEREKREKRERKEKEKKERKEKKGDGGFEISGPSSFKKVEEEEVGGEGEAVEGGGIMDMTAMDAQVIYIYNYIIYIYIKIYILTVFVCIICLLIDLDGYLSLFSHVIHIIYIGWTCFEGGRNG